MLEQYVQALQLLGDENRLRLCALLSQGEIRVTDLVRVTGLTQSRVSTHLGRLREAGLAHDRREGQQSFYALTLDRLVPAARSLLLEAIEAPDPTLERDRLRLRELRAKRDDPSEVDIERDYSPGRSWQSLCLGLAAGLRFGDVLDVGCGDGSASACIAPYCRALTCVDSDPVKIEHARRRLSPFGHVHAQTADVHALPFPNASFGVVLLFHTLTYTEDPLRALTECTRVLKPTGRVLILCLDKHEHQRVTKRFHERHPGFAPESLRVLMKDAGLTPVQAGVACRENRKPHLLVSLAVGCKPTSEEHPS